MSHTRKNSSVGTPSFSFGGRGVSRDPSQTAKSAVNVPGPGTYSVEASTGKQLDSRKTTQPKPAFPVSTRSQANKVFAGTPTQEFVCSPGPGCYDVPSTIGAVTYSEARRPGSSAAFGKARGVARTERRLPRAPASPGPGEYDHKSTNARQYSSFGVADRKSAVVDRQYPGPGMPVYPNPEEQHPLYTGQITSLGHSPYKKSSAAYSFGGRTPTPVRGARPRTTDAGGARSPRAAASRPKTVDGAAARGKQQYEWLTRGGRPQREQDSQFQQQFQSQYVKTLDGADMPRASEFVKQPQFSFGRDDRFGDALYLPHKPQVRANATPGAVYDIPETLGVESPAYSFPRETETGAEQRRRALQPGPGAYNLRLEHRAEALLEESSSVGGGDRRRSPRATSPRGAAASPRGVDSVLSDAHSARSQRRRATARRATAASTPVGSAQEFGLKFGDVPARRTAPAFSFGSGDREGRARRYDCGELNKEMAGTASPGPGTASREMAERCSRFHPKGWTTPHQHSFGGAHVPRNPVPRSSTDVGPAQFGPLHSTGEQASSTERTAPRPRFGTAPRAKIDLLYCPNDKPPHVPYGSSPHKETPASTLGVFEKGVSSFNKQLASAKPNSPDFSFGKSIRDRETKLYLPQNRTS